VLRRTRDVDVQTVRLLKVCMDVWSVGVIFMLVMNSDHII
jgi:hypothetical protein